MEFMLQRWVKWALFVAAWSFIGFFFAVQEWFTYPPQKPPVSWARQLTSELGFWYAWALLVPLIWWLARRVPLESVRLARSLLLHIPAAAVFAVAQPYVQII